MSYLETRAGPKMGGQILGDFVVTKMAITCLKIKIFKKNQKVLACVGPTMAYFTDASMCHSASVS